MRPPSRPTEPSPAVLAFYNAVPNVLWSGLSLIPLTVFCYQHVARPWLGLMLAGSLLGFGMPRAWLRRGQLSAGPTLYRRLGVPELNHFTQHGTLVNALIRRHYPHYRHVRPTRRSREARWRVSYQLERFHLGLFLFFLAVSLYALGHGYAGWALVLTTSNVLYNLYPMWLQQYLRVRLGFGRT